MRRWPSLARQLALSLVLVAGAACTLPFCGDSGASAPIVGYWTWDDGVIQVKSVGSGKFEGRFVKARTGECPPAVGRLVLKFSGSGTHYTGQDEWYRTPDCATRFSKDAKFDVSNGNQSAKLCSSGPFTDVPAKSNCKELTRLPNYKPK